MLEIKKIKFDENSGKAIIDYVIDNCSNVYHGNGSDYYHMGRGGCIIKSGLELAAVNLSEIDSEVLNNLGVKFI